MKLRNLLWSVALVAASSISSAQVGQQPGVTQPPTTAFGGGTITAPILGPTGSCAAPNFSWTGDTDSGLCQLSANYVALQTRNFGGASNNLAAVQLREGIRSALYYHGAAGLFNVFSAEDALLQMGTSGVTRVTIDTAKVTSTLPFQGPAGSASAPAYSFSAETTLGCWRSAVGEVRCTTGTFGANYGETVTGTSIAGFQWYDAGSLANGAYSNISGTRLVRAGVNVFDATATSLTLTKVTGGSVVDADATSTRLRFGSVTYLAVDASGVDFVDGGTKPTCNSAARGHVWLDEGGAGVADTFEACMKSAADTFAWVVIATNP